MLDLDSIGEGRITMYIEVPPIQKRTQMPDGGFIHLLCMIGIFILGQLAEPTTRRGRRILYIANNSSRRAATTPEAEAKAKACS